MMKSFTQLRTQTEDESSDDESGDEQLHLQYNGFTVQQCTLQSQRDCATVQSQTGHPARWSVRCVCILQHQLHKGDTTIKETDDITK